MVHVQIIIPQDCDVTKPRLAFSRVFQEQYGQCGVPGVESVLEGEACSHFLSHIQSTGPHILKVWSGDTLGSQDHFRDPGGPGVSWGMDVRVGL